MPLVVPPELERRLLAIATSTDRDPQAVLDETVAEYIEDESAFLAAVQEGREAAARGDVVPHAQVMAEIDAIIAAAEERLNSDRQA